ncbi:hypothetical protein evm_010083 [Chilo suppressalis]|nr:hypothetical protein evm_010083 [Chilo suppressalis]
MAQSPYSIRGEGLCPSSGDINRLMMMMIPDFVLVRGRLSWGRLARMVPEVTAVTKKDEEAPRPKITAATLYNYLKNEFAIKDKMQLKDLTPEQLNNILLEYAFKGNNIIYKST